MGGAVFKHRTSIVYVSITIIHIYYNVLTLLFCVSVLAPASSSNPMTM